MRVTVTISGVAVLACVDGVDTVDGVVVVDDDAEVATVVVCRECGHDAGQAKNVIARL